MENLNTTKKQYKTMVEKASPNSHIVTNCLKAFLVGGMICALGQFIGNTLINSGLSKDSASMYTSIILMFLAALATGIGWYDTLGKFAGAGSVVPITGFSNSVTAPAVEFKKEGFILGVGAKMFVIAGPVIVYGTFASVVIGLIYFLL
jgi:stage V sporulation protein AC